MINNLLNLLKSINPTNAAGIDNIAGKFLKEGASVLATPLTQICNLSICLSTFPDKCKHAKLKPLLKKIYYHRTTKLSAHFSSSPNL